MAAWPSPSPRVFCASRYASAYGGDPEFYAFYRSLDAYRESFKDGKGVLLLDPESEFLRYLKNSK